MEHVRDMLYELVSHAESPRELQAIAWEISDDDSRRLLLGEVALQAAKRAVELAPEDPQNWRTQGIMGYRAGHWSDAVRALAKAESLKTGSDSVCNGFFLAMAHWQLGRRDEARMWYDRSVEMIDRNQPNNDEIARTHAETEQLLNIVEKELTDQPALKP